MLSSRLTLVCSFALPFAVAACAGHHPGFDGDEDLSSDESDDPAGSDDGDDDGDGPGLGLEVETPDGACVDLSVTDRETYAVRFSVTGPANSVVALWASKPTCDGEPFHYRDISLDETGRGVFDLEHAGSDSCGEGLLGTWTTWLEYGSDQSDAAALVFANALCEAASSCAPAAGYCPPDDPPAGPKIPQDELFVLSDEERELFTPPPDWLEWGMAYEDYPLRNLWEAFDAGAPVVPLDPEAGPSGWLEPDGTGSQNHALLWLGVAALGHGLAGDVDAYETAAANSITVLGLDAMQGHMRHEAVGQYAGFWQGGIATMALAGLYAPEGSTLGPELLETARRWWADHIEVLRRLSVPDGQVALIGARLPGEPGTEDSWASLSAAINLQLMDPRPHDQLHATIASFVTADGRPAPGTDDVPVRWYRPRHVSERWVVLRAIQSGALPPIPDDHPRPALVQDVYRWTVGDRIHTAVQAITGYRPARWHVSWAPGEVLRVEVGDPGSTPHTGKGPHAPPESLDIPGQAELILGPGD